MNPPHSKILNKNQLLQWLNSMIKSTGCSFSKIQQLGNGTGYLYLLLSIHPQIASTTNILHKHIKKPTTQYQYITNLKLLSTLFIKLGIDKNVQVDKLAKMKMQDNLMFLQWFYGYFCQQKTRKQEDGVIDVKGEFDNVGRRQGSCARQIGENNGNGIDLNAGNDCKNKIKDQQKGNMRNKPMNIKKNIQENKNINQNQPKKIKIKAPTHLNTKGTDKSNKMDIQQKQSQVVQFKSINNTASKRIHEIEQIIHNQNYNNNETKLTKIMQILNLKQNKSYQVTPAKTNITHNKFHENPIQKNENICINSLNTQPQKKQITYIKCRKLQQKYQQYMKSNIFRKPEQSYGHSSFKTQFSKQKRQSIRIASANDNQIFYYEPQIHNQEKNENMRLTDNSILLQSDRKSVQSQNLLPQE